MPQYRSQSPVHTYNSGRSAPQSVNLRPEWYSPNGRQQFSPNRGGYQSPNFRDQGRGQSQYQGQHNGVHLALGVIRTHTISGDRH